MAHLDNQFSEDYINGAIEKLRGCLRDLKKVNDRPTALATRERCKNWMGQAVKVFKELQEAYDDAVFEIRGLKEEVEEAKAYEERFEYIRGQLADVQRGIMTLDELAVLASDMRYGEMVNVR